MKLACAVMLIFLPITSDAQEAVVRGHGALEGIVEDSLRGGFLRGAALRVAGTSRIGFTDSLGRYRIDSVPAGARQVELFHEMLDTLGVRVQTPPVTFVADSVVRLLLSIPSAPTIVRAKCPAAGEYSTALMGVVLDADNGEALADAVVRLWWVEITAGREIGVLQQPRQRLATTDADGRFKICGLPTDLTAEISAARGSDSTGAVRVNYGESRLGMATLFLGTRDSPDASAAGRGTGTEPGATVRGVVVDGTGKPLAGARVGLASSPDAAVTDSTGTFMLTGQRPGTQSLVVRRLGFQPVELVVNLTRREPREVRIRLDVFVPVLAAVLVQARRDLAMERVGFTSRRRAGMGRYLTQEDLDRRNAFRISDFLTQIPGLHRGSGMGGACITYWVDGVRWEGEPDDFMAPEEVAALEAYSPASAPAEFQGSESCAVVVIWTKWKLGVR